jgi:protein disulfide-isomerase-like protein
VVQEMVRSASFWFGAFIMATVAGKAVQSVTGVELDKLIAEGKSVFTKFYSPKCPHCVKVAPIWEELADKLASEGDATVVADVDCTQNREACKRFNVQGVPSLQLLKEDKVYLYKGARDLANFVKFVVGGGYLENGVQVSGVPGAEKIKTFTEKIVDGGMELIQQLTAIVNYSPIIVILLLGLGFLSGASVTGLVVLATKKTDSAAPPCEAKPATAAKKAGEKTD